jgi:hypothetical protein
MDDQRTSPGWDDSEWVQSHYDELDEFGGQWIGVKSQRVVASGPSVSAVTAQLREQKLKHVLVIKVPSRSEREAYFIG